MSDTSNKSPSSKRNVRDEIVESRLKRIEAEGHEFGCPIPATRTRALLPFVTDPLLICEIKRKSPSRGNINAGLDPVAQARLYQEKGVRSVSVLTEEDFFGGSLRDLMAVKDAVPGLAVLRKDFLVDEEDVRVSWRAGADAILLIASMLDHERLGSMLHLAESLGMAVLVEVHSKEEILKVAPLNPRLMGINSRNLETFAMDLLLPLTIRPYIDWECRVVFESGLFVEEDARYAAQSGFAGLLVGEAVVRQPERIPQLLKGFARGFEPYAAAPERAWARDLFWNRIARMSFERSTRPGPRRPLVKICGICRREDALAALEQGADILGFIFAESPRRCPPGLLESLADLDCLKVAVVCNQVPAEVQDLVERGLIHAVQFSGDEEPTACAGLSWPYYKALRPKAVEDIKVMDQYRSPRVLLDAFSEGSYGGTGKRLDPALVAEAAKSHALWLAGGIKPDNVAGLVEEWRPELIDIASGVEESPGIKSKEKLASLAKEIQRVCV